MDLGSLFEETCARRSDAIAFWWEERSHSFSDLRDAARRVAGGLRSRGVRPGDRIAIRLPNGPENIFSHWGVQLAGAVRVPVNFKYTDEEAAYPIRTADCRLVIDPALVGELLQADPAPPEKRAPDDVAMICFTSGTTSKPKMVPLTHGNLISNIRGLVEVWEWTENDTLLLCLPLMHLHGLGNGLHGWIAAGCTLVLQPKFDAGAVLREIERRRVTMFFGVPAMYHRLLEAGPKADLSSLRLWVSGSAPLDRGLEEKFANAFGKPLVNRYGMTETVMITANPARDPRPGSVGRPLPGVEVRIVDGEITVRGPNVGNVERDADGWFRTGDLGVLEDGWLRVTGRAKDLIICGGTNISPMEIEETLLRHPDVSEAAVFGAPDEALGEVPWAVVVCSGAVTGEALRGWADGRMAKFKRLRRVIVVESPLPRNAMQKLDRNKVRELYGQ